MIVVNPSTRQFNIPGADLVFGVTADAGSVTKEFSCPRYVGNNLDLMGCFIRMNYQNANGEIDSYLVKDVTVDGDNIVFGWELSPKVTMYRGNVSFVMCVTGPDTKVKWHTTLGRGQVLEGLEPDWESVMDETVDVVAQLVAMVEAQTEAVENKGAEWVRNVQSEGTDQIIAVQTAARESREAAVAEIEAKGVNVRESIPDDYTALSEVVETLNRTRGAAIVCEAAGETVVVGDSSNLPMQGLRVFGKTTQVTTTGAQLIPQPYFDKGKTSNGVSWTVNEDGSLNAKGTATANSALYLTDSYYRFVEGSYVLSGSTNNVMLRVDASDASTGKWVKALATSKNGSIVPFTVTVADLVAYTFTVYAMVESGVTANDTVWPMVNVGSTALTYEPYTGGKPSPSPEYPQELVNLEPTVTVAGKNLLDTSQFLNENVVESNGVYTLTRNTGGERFSGMASLNVPAGVKFTASLEIVDSTSSSGRLPVFFKGVSGESHYISFTGTHTCVYDEPIIAVGLYLASSEAVGAHISFKNLQIRLGSEATEYEPYKPIQTVELTHTLPGIPVTSGGNYTDSDGQQWICDEVDLERGVYVQRVEKWELTGTEHCILNNRASEDSINVFQYYTRSNKPIAGAFQCSHFTNAGAWDKGLKDGENIAWLTRSVLMFKTDGTQTLEDFTSFVLAQHNAGTPVTINHAMETPIETPLSEPEIAAYRALHSNYPNTTVLNDSGAHMVVKYAADTKLYIDNKIAALIGG